MKDYGTDAMAASEEDFVEVAGTRQPVPNANMWRPRGGDEFQGGR